MLPLHPLYWSLFHWGRMGRDGRVFIIAIDSLFQSLICAGFCVNFKASVMQRLFCTIKSKAWSKVYSFTPLQATPEGPWLLFGGSHPAMVVENVISRMELKVNLQLFIFSFLLCWLSVVRTHWEFRLTLTYCISMCSSFHKDSCIWCQI